MQSENRIWFVTGGNGFIGTHLIRDLVARGIEVRALARSDRSAAAITELGATPIRGELDRPAQWASHLDEVSTFVHLAAAHPPEWRRKVYRRTNEDALRAVAEECVPRDIRFIHISSEAAVMDGTPMVDVDESRPLAIGAKALYPASKAVGEVIVTEACRRGLDGIILRPRFVWGPGDHSLEAVVASIDAGKFKMLGDGKQLTSTTHVDNLLHAIHLAESAGERGEAYFVADEGTIEFGEMAAAMAGAMNRELPAGSVSLRAAQTLAKVVEAVWRLPFKAGPPLTLSMVWLLGLTVTVDTTKAARDLGYQPTTSRAAGLKALRDSYSATERTDSL
ncbi:NAD-dependent epimerase/dehydratase family protein [Nocardia sp. NPDC058705]|uniref:NAD-dependent epimerase/dehydratase family protein n=1 Tax=Nocardia sp. NPDC058705 TaxID=3346609 RepID=UPI0036CDCD05